MRTPTPPPTRSVSLTKPEVRLLLELLEAMDARERQRDHPARLELGRLWSKLPHAWARGKETRWGGRDGMEGASTPRHGSFPPGGAGG